MNISVQKLLGKMEKELLEAKSSSSDARIRERVQAIKSLCELILDESDAGSAAAVSTISIHTVRRRQLSQRICSQRKCRWMMRRTAIHC
nr:YwdI family protein [Cytobacillus firmus]